MSEEKSEILLPPYMLVTAEDFASAELETPIRDNTDADAEDICAIYRDASENKKAEGDAESQKAYAALSAVMSFHFKPANKNEPFSAMAIFGDRRSAIPDDFLGEPLQALKSIASSIENLPLSVWPESL